MEQTAHGPRPALPILDAFDGLGVDRHAGDAPPRNPSDNSLAAGPDHLVQTVNSQIAVFTKRGRAVRDQRAAAVRAGGDQRGLRRARRGVRQPRQRRRRRSLRPARRAVVGRDAHLPARGAGGDAAPARSRRPASPPGRVRPPTLARRSRRRGTAASQRHRCDGRRQLRHLLRDQHRRRSPRPLSPLRLRAHAVPRLPASGGVARRLLPADQHRRRGDREARLRRRPRPDARRPARHRAVPGRRRRELPEHRRPRRPDAAAARRAQHRHGHRRHPAPQRPRRRRHLCVAGPRRLGAAAADAHHRAAQDRRSRRIAICAAASSPTACRNRAWSAGSTPRATSSWRG